LALQDKVSRAWLNFARTGNPSQPGLKFKPYTAEDPQAMVFDTVSECRALRDDKLASLMPRPAGRGRRGLKRFTTCGLQARVGGSEDPPYLGCETGCRRRGDDYFVFKRITVTESAGRM
jgi:hypothetical protein